MGVALSVAYEAIEPTHLQQIDIGINIHSKNATFTIWSTPSGANAFTRSEAEIQMRTSPAPGRVSGISPTTNTSLAGPCFSYELP